jgi:hypothetical protein
MDVTTAQDDIYDATNTACFDGSDIDTLDTLKEFLESHGIHAVDNAPISTDCFYHIIHGSPNVVKEILSRSLRKSVRRIVMVQTKHPSSFDAKPYIIHEHVVVLSCKKITHEEAARVFSFFFNHTENPLYLPNREEEERIPLNSEGLEAKPVTTPAPSPITTEHHLSRSRKSDEERINSLIQKTYTKKSPIPFFRLNKIGLVFRYTLLLYIGIIFSHVLSVVLFFACLFGAFRYAAIRLPAFTVLPVISEIATKTYPYAIGPFLLLPKAPTFFEPYEKVLQILTLTAEGTKIVQQLTAIQIHESNITTALSSVAPLIDAAQEKTSLLISETKALKETRVPLWRNRIVTNALETIEEKLVEVKTIETEAKAASLLIPLLAGTEGDKEYLLLLQNSQELRPTGGFIGSVGYLRFHNGVYNGITIEDVYALDGQLRGHVQPPEPIRTILGQEHWYLRDSNWSPDFPTTGKQAIFFAEHSVNKTFSGVIAVSLPVLQQILAAVGPIPIPDYQTQISASSLSEFLNKEATTNFFPGSTGKKDALGAVGKQLLLRLFSSKNKEDYLAIAKVLATSIENGDILFYATDQKTQNQLLVAGWAGIFPPKPKCTETTCYENSIAVNEANLSVNKANGYVSREFSRNLTVGQEGSSGEDTLTINNTPPTGTVSGGTYTPYIRFYYPPQTTINAIRINGLVTSLATPATNSASLPFTEVSREQIGQEVVSVAINVPENQKSVISIEYQSPQRQEIEQISTTIYRQPGIAAFPVSLSVSVPKDILPKLEKESGKGQFVAKMGYFQYNTLVASEESLRVRL